MHLNDTRLLWTCTSKVYTFRPLPRFSAQSPNEDGNEDHAPFPTDTSVQEDNMIQAWNVQRREHDEEYTNDCEEQELVTPKMLRPHLEALGHVEERPAEVDELPRKKEEDPGHGRVAGGSGAEDGIAFGGVLVVAVAAEVARVEAEDYNGEGAEDAACHEETVDDHVGEEFGCKDSVFQLWKLVAVYHY